MKRKPVRPRAAATADFDGITDFYLVEAGAEIALRFGEALSVAFGCLEDSPRA